MLRIVLLCLLLALGSGCSTLAPTSGGENADQTTSENQPYFPSGVTDIQIPSELSLVRDNSMFINTASYNGGIMTFEGRVEIGSLADYFITTMKKNGWSLAGSVRYNNVLLAFVKPAKSCIITIQGRGVSFKTRVSIYLTEDTLKTQDIESGGILQ